MSDSKAGPRDEERTRSSSPESGRLVLQTGDETLVVAVGASAGGLEPLKRLLGAVPRDANLAIVVIQHLSPTRESLLTSALQAASPLTVMEVHDGMPLAAGQVQVIPPNMTLALQDGRLRLHPRDDSERPPMPIDTFMRSLAAERKTEAIGVVLSGMGSDGTEGLKAIRAAGGRTYAQDPSTTAHDAMPRSAIAADVVDLILAPEGIAADLAALALARGAPARSDEDVPRAPEGSDAFREIVHLLNVETGVDVSHYKETTLRRRIMRRMALVSAAGDDEYLRRLREDEDELNALHDDLFIHVTSFFRDPGVFAALEEHVFPALLQGRGRGVPLRLWVPGCSTGEEAYSLAIAALEYLETHRSDVPIQVFATDISERAIHRARSAEYPAGIAEHVSEDRRRRFFEQISKGYRIARSVRETCVFVRHDLTADPPFSRIDLLSCRNVLIYFDTVLQKQVIPSFHYALNEPGFLVLGHTEALSGFGELFRPVDKKHKIFARRPGAGRTHAGSRIAGAIGRGVRPTVGPPARAPQDLNRALDLLLLSRHVPAAVLVNDALEIVQVRGRTGPYLEPAAGTASLNLLKMARGGLAADLTLLVQRARAENAPVRKEGVRLREDGDISCLDLEVEPLDGLSRAERHFVVVFRERSAPRAAPRPDRTARGADEGSLVAELQHELAASKTYVSSVIEQYAVTNQAFAGSNEALQTANEELQSTNEELETAKEELQSSNEELTTVNDELQARYQEVNELGNDLVNLVTSTDIPIVIVDRERKVRRFTPKARSAFNLIPADVGRAIAEIRPNVEVPKLDAWIAGVIETTAVKEAEVRDPDGRWQRVQIRPYQMADGRIDGAVVSLVDIDALKRAVTDARRARDFAAAALETVPVPVLVLDSRQRVTSANRAFYEGFRASPTAAGRALTDLGPGPWQSAAFAARVRGGIEGGAPFQDVELEYELPDVGRRVMVMSGRVVPDALDGDRSLVLAIEDVTERRRIEEERARAQAEEAQRFLNEAGAAMLPESLDIEATLAAVAHLVVPRFADWCVVDLVEADGTIRQAAAAHVDPVKEQLARDLRRTLRPEAQPERGVASVIRTGESVFHPEVGDLAWVAGALGTDQPEFLRELGARSYVAVPLHGRKGVIGAISFVRGLPGRRYGASDLAVAEGLGQRVGLALENASLYLAAREAVVARDDFLAIAAHELRTPLSTLTLQLQTLAATRERELTEAVAAGKLERAIKQTRRLASLIDSLLEVSRITAGKLTLHREPTDLAAVVQEVAQRSLAGAEAAGCALTVRAKEPVTGVWDPLRLDQIVTNLLQNSIRHAPGTPIELSVEGSERRARLAVRDHGPGIPAHKRARIFDRFEKGGAGSQESQEGLGLGLYITRQIVEAHGGTIRLETGAEAGTTFFVELPRGGDPGGGTPP